MISIVVKIPLKEGKAEEFIEAFKAVAAGVSTEEGNCLYTLSFAKKEPDTAVIMERYIDKDALTEHSQTDHFKAFGPKIGDLVAGAAEMTIMKEVVAA